MLLKLLISLRRGKNQKVPQSQKMKRTVMMMTKKKRLMERWTIRNGLVGGTLAEVEVRGLIMYQKMKKVLKGKLVRGDGLVRRKVLFPRQKFCCLYVEIKVYLSCSNFFFFFNLYLQILFRHFIMRGYWKQHYWTNPTLNLFSCLFSPPVIFVWMTVNGSADTSLKHCLT